MILLDINFIFQMVVCYVSILTLQRRLEIKIYYNSHRFATSMPFSYELLWFLKYCLICLIARLHLSFPKIIPDYLNFRISISLIFYNQILLGLQRLEKWQSIYNGKFNLYNRSIFLEAIVGFAPSLQYD